MKLLPAERSELVKLTLTRSKDEREIIPKG